MLNTRERGLKLPADKAVIYRVKLNVLQPIPIFADREKMTYPLSNKLNNSYNLICISIYTYKKFEIAKKIK